MNACYANGTGKLRIVDSSADCHGAETFLSWNSEGEPGPQGAQGPEWPAGSGFATSAVGAFSISLAACTVTEVASTPLTLAEPAALFASGQGELSQHFGTGGVAGILVMQLFDASTRSSPSTGAPSRTSKRATPIPCW